MVDSEIGGWPLLRFGKILQTTYGKRFGFSSEYYADSLEGFEHLCVSKGLWLL